MLMRHFLYLFTTFQYVSLYKCLNMGAYASASMHILMCSRNGVKNELKIHVQNSAKKRRSSPTTITVKNRIILHTHTPAKRRTNRAREGERNEMARQTESEAHKRMYVYGEKMRCCTGRGQCPPLALAPHREYARAISYQVLAASASEKCE